MNILSKFRESARMLSHVRTITLAAMLIALNVALGSVRIYVTPEMRLSMGFVTQTVAGMVLGPVVAMITGAVGDIVSLMIFPSGAYFPGYTLTAIVGGMINGLMLFRQGKISIPRALITRVLINVICYIGMNTLWLTMTTGKGMLALLPARAIKNAVLCPIEAAIVFLIAIAVQSAIKHTRFGIKQ